MPLKFKVVHVDDGHNMAWGKPKIKPSLVQEVEVENLEVLAEDYDGSITEVQDGIWLMSTPPDVYLVVRQ